MYSIERVLPGQLNSPNFEVPFAFYDLSGKGVGYPNLLLRTVRTIKNAPLSEPGNPETQSIRYSWRNAVGDWRWDYKIDVLGQYEYTSETPIAGGAAVIDAPSYEAFPSWVIDRSWSAVSFVDREERLDLSSEGIYDWSMRGVSEEYLFGWEREPVLIQFQDIRTGFRGEYRLSASQKPTLYMSPVDNRLHLKWAEQGIWRLDEAKILRVANLDSDAYLDVWSQESLAAATERDTSAVESSEDGAVAADNSASEAQVIETVYALDGYLLYTDGDRITIVAGLRAGAL